MDKKIKPHNHIHDALQLDGRPDTMIEYYKKWSETYDKDVTDNYFGIAYIAELLHKHLSENQQDHIANMEQINIVDVGCGTGLAGKHIHQLGYRSIDGIDLSPEMIQKAEESGVYRNLISGIDIHQPIQDNLYKAYDAAVCVGVFTMGHIHPESLYQLAALTTSGGIMVISTRVPYYKETNFQAVSDQMQEEGLLTLKSHYMNAPYRDDGDAHYWVYEVLS